MGTYAYKYSVLHTQHIVLGTGTSRFFSLPVIVVSLLKMRDDSPFRTPYPSAFMIYYQIMDNLVHLSRDSRGGLYT
jgi:hypothetical protein